MLTDSIKYGQYCNLLPTAGLCAYLCDALPVLYPKFFQAFGKNFLPFKKIDNSTVSLPIMLIYPSQSTSIGESWYKKGTLFFDQVYSGAAMIRERSTEIACVISDLITDIVLKDVNFFNKAKYGPPDINGNPTWGPFPALLELGDKISVEYSENNSLFKQQDTVTIRQRVSYTLDIVQWWNYIQEVKGNTIYDPCVNIYPLIENYIAEIQLVSSQEG